MNWQPIETAPKDGTAILVWHPEPHVSRPADELGTYADNQTILIAWWHDYGTGNGHFYIDEKDSTGDHDWMYPTHWMPLPEPPAQ